MRRMFLAVAAAAAMLAAGSLTRAEAMPVGDPAGVRAALESTSITDQVAYVCRRFWSCGYWGCGWRRSCYWAPGYYGYYRPYYRRWRYY
jgi:hypothetical protein